MSVFVSDIKIVFGLDQHILVTLQLFCRFLSGCPVALAGTVNRKEPQQLGEVLRTQRVHDVIRGSGDICIALCHCVLCGSFWCFGRSKVTLFISFLLNSFFTATCLFARSHQLLVFLSLFHTRDHKCQHVSGKDRWWRGLPCPAVCSLVFGPKGETAYPFLDHVSLFSTFNLLLVWIKCGAVQKQNSLAPETWQLCTRS